MIYLDVDPKEIDEENYEASKPCAWECGSEMLPKSVRTKDSIGIQWCCTNCKAWTVILRPYTDEAKAFWNQIV